jgi:SHAQKYF class myb-like DNA-binding protein
MTKRGSSDTVHFSSSNINSLSYRLLSKSKRISLENKEEACVQKDNCLEKKTLTTKKLGITSQTWLDSKLSMAMCRHPRIGAATTIAMRKLPASIWNRVFLFAYPPDCCPETNIGLKIAMELSQQLPTIAIGFERCQAPQGSPRTCDMQEEDMCEAQPMDINRELQMPAMNEKPVQQAVNGLNSGVLSLEEQAFLQVVLVGKRTDSDDKIQMSTEAAASGAILNDAADGEAEEATPPPFIKFYSDLNGRFMQMQRDLQASTVQSVKQKVSGSKGGESHTSSLHEGLLPAAEKVVGAFQNRIGAWTERERTAFVNGLGTHGRNWKEVRKLVKTRNLTQIRTHAQKFFRKVKRDRQLAINRDDKHMVEHLTQLLETTR